MKNEEKTGSAALGGLRAEIDSIDDEIARLFRRRMEVVDLIAAAKRSRGAAVNDPAREREILSRVEAVAGPEFGDCARSLFSGIFEIAKKRQRELLVV